MGQADTISVAIKSLANIQPETVLGIRPAQVLATLSKFRAEAVSTEYVERQRKSNDTAIVDVGPSASEKVEDPIRKVWRVYEELLKQRGALDFDLLLLRTIKLLEDKAAVSGKRIDFLSKLNS